MGLTTLEQLQNIAYLQNIQVNKYALPMRLRGLYYEEGNYRTISINSNVTTPSEEVDVMAEEIGHSVWCGGDLFFPNSADPILKLKSEYNAKAYAYNLVLPVNKLMDSLKNEMEIWDIAEEFGCTEVFVREAMEGYTRKGILKPPLEKEEGEFEC